MSDEHDDTLSDEDSSRLLPSSAFVHVSPVSGNPRGRPKGVKSLAAVVAGTLGERIAVTENGHRKRITKLEAVVKQLVNRAPPERRALQLLLALVQASEARPPQADANRLAEG